MFSYNFFWPNSFLTSTQFGRVTARRFGRRTNKKWKIRMKIEVSRIKAVRIFHHKMPPWIISENWIFCFTFISDHSRCYYWQYLKLQNDFFVDYNHSYLMTFLVMASFKIFSNSFFDPKRTTQVGTGRIFSILFSNINQLVL